MKCSKCGTANNAGNNFCSNCGGNLTLGTPLNNSAEDLNVLQQPHKNNLEYKSMATFTAPQINGLEQPMTDVDSSLSRTNAPIVQKESIYIPLDTSTVIASDSVKPGMKNKMVFIIVTCCIGALLLIGLGIYFLFPQIMKNSLTPHQYYAMAEKNALSENEDSIFELMKKISDTPMSCEGEIGLSLKYPEQKELEDIIGAFLLKFDTHSDPSKNLSKTTIDVKMFEKNIVTLLLQEEEGRIGLSYPDLVDGQIVSPSFKWIIDLMTMDEKTLNEVTGMNTSQRNKLVEEIFQKVIVESIDDEHITEGTNTIEGINCSTVEFKIDNVVVEKMSIAMAEQIRNNKQLRIAFANAIEYFKEKAQIMYESASEEQDLEEPNSDEILNELADSLSDISSSNMNNETSVTYKVGYNSKGKIVSRKLVSDVNQNGFETVSYKKDNENIFVFRIYNDGQKNDIIKNVYGSKSGIVKGKMTMNWDGMFDDNQAIVIEYSYDKNATAGGVPVFVGDIAILFKAGINETANITIKFDKVSDDTVESGVDAKVKSGYYSMEFAANGSFKYSSQPKIDIISVEKKSTQDIYKSLDYIERTISERVVDALSSSGKFNNLF